MNRSPTDPGAVPAAPPAAGDPESPSDAPRPLWLSGRLWVPVILVVAGLLSFSGTLDDRAQVAADRVFQQALITFAAARALDAAVSLAEGTEIALQPAGVGVTVSAGEVLEPIDHMVEQFSSVMLISTTSLGVQSLLLRASAWRVITGLLVLALLLRVATVFYPASFHPAVRRGVQVAASVLLIARFAVPVYAWSTSLIFERWLQPAQVEAVQALDETSGDVAEIEQLAEPSPDVGIVGRVSSWFSDAVERLDVSERIEAFRERVSDTVEDLMQLLVIFVLQTIVLPIAFLWVVSRMLGSVFSRG
ncbi:hypothetical protein V3331_13450 [Gaopeijia maritima]|uniref:hypothetical protein n=1 Tax=Gaopeijia maritima TaxID=3119007 RepID=UPI00324A44BA